ncbi:hypothetical protein F2Q68_00034995 [Brassica cretica]|uniref:Uncharacterized protein n=1 Tax=Brassica cretica TaxID=69181 RepID=A0A8S9GYM6_BRACR|nr:hypothetical protein F2Q68_00034995 [Brassica cretica]
MKNSEMKQSKKLLEDIAGIAGNCLAVCPSQEGKIRLYLWIRTCGVLDIWSHHRGMLRQFPQESPLANGHILIDGQVLIRLMASSTSNMCVDSLPNHVVLGGVSCLSVQWHKVMLKCNLFKNIKGCVESLSSSDDWMAGHVQSSSGTKRVQGSVHMGGIERLKSKSTCRRMFRSPFKHLNRFPGSQLKTIDEGDGYSEWQWDCHIPFIRRLKKIMKELQAWLKVELREVRRDKRRQGDAEDEQACSSIKRCQHKVRVMDLDQTGGVL